MKYVSFFIVHVFEGQVETVSQNYSRGAVPSGLLSGQGGTETERVPVPPVDVSPDGRPKVRPYGTFGADPEGTRRVGS